MPARRAEFDSFGLLPTGHACRGQCGEVSMKESAIFVMACVLGVTACSSTDAGTHIDTGSSANSGGSAGSAALGSGGAGSSNIDLGSNPGSSNSAGSAGTGQ